MSSPQKENKIPTKCNKRIDSKGDTKERRPFTVVVEGNIGSGKTTFLEHFNKHDLVEVLTEPVEEWRNVGGNNLLQLMYENPSRWSHIFQSYVQLTMTQNHVRKISSQKQIKMMERSLFSARHCFVENLHDSGKMSDAEFSVLCEWFDFLASGNLSSVDVGVDLIIYLRTEPEVAYERKKSRARKEEEVVPLEYFEELHRLHEKWLSNNDLLPAPVLVIDANVDLKKNPNAYTRYNDKIMQHYRDPSNIKASRLKEISNRVNHLVI